MIDLKTSRFDVAEYLTDETLINAYLNEVLTEGEPSEFIEPLIKPVAPRTIST